MGEQEMGNGAPLDVNAAEVLPRRRWLYRMLWLVAPLLYVAIVWHMGWEKIRDQAFQAHIPLFAGMLGCEAAGLWLRALKWRAVLGPGTNAIGVFFMSKGAGNYSPGRVGELSPLLLPSKRTARLGAWIVLDRVIESMHTLLFGLVGLLFIEIQNKKTALVLVVGLCTAACLFFVFLLKGRPFAAVASHTRGGSYLHRFAQLLASLQQAVVDLAPKLPVAIAMTLGATLLELTGGILLYRSFGYTVNMAMAAAAKCAHGLVGAIPVTPSMTGMPHVATGLVMHEVAGIPGPTLAAALTLHAFSMNVMFAVFFAIGIRNLRRKKTGVRSQELEVGIREDRRGNGNLEG